MNEPAVLSKNCVLTHFRVNTLKRIVSLRETIRRLVASTVSCRRDTASLCLTLPATPVADIKRAEIVYLATQARALNLIRELVYANRLKKCSIALLGGYDFFLHF